MYYLETDKEFKKSIKNAGFKNTMEKYNVSYLVTYKDEPRYIEWAYVFYDMEMPQYIDRTYIILYQLNPKEQYYPDESKRIKIVEDYKIEEKFILEKQIGDYSIYAFQN
jgi:hypothetical protein